LSDSKTSTHNTSPAATKVSDPIFIHSALDDYGLTPQQFRVVCHVARRGVCYGAAKGIGAVCKMHRDTVFACLMFLTKCGILKQQKRPGETTVYSVAPLSEWHPSETKGRVNPSETKGRPHRKRRDTGCRKVRDTHPSETKGHKGNPPEVTPPKAIHQGGSSPPVSLRMFPGEVSREIKDLKEEIRRTKTRHQPLGLPEAERAALHGMYERLRSLETVKYGAPRTANGAAIPTTTTEPLSPGTDMALRDLEKLKATQNPDTGAVDWGEAYRAVESAPAPKGRTVRRTLKL
jgi:hypothetical protein